MHDVRASLWHGSQKAGGERGSVLDELGEGGLLLYGSISLPTSLSPCNPVPARKRRKRPDGWHDSKSTRCRHSLFKLSVSAGCVDGEMDKGDNMCKEAWHVCR